jgi:hypothetical protein
MTVVKGSELWQSVHIVGRRQVMDEIVHGPIKARGGLSAQTYKQ